MSTFSGDETAPFFGFLGAAAALVFSCKYLFSLWFFLFWSSCFISFLPCLFHWKMLSRVIAAWPCLFRRIMVNISSCSTGGIYTLRDISRVGVEINGVNCLTEKVSGNYVRSKWKQSSRKIPTKQSVVFSHIGTVSCGNKWGFFLGMFLMASLQAWARPMGLQRAGWVWPPWEWCDRSSSWNRLSQLLWLEFWVSMGWL